MLLRRLEHALRVRVREDVPVEADVVGEPPHQRDGEAASAARLPHRLRPPLPHRRHFPAVLACVEEAEQRACVHLPARVGAAHRPRQLLHGDRVVAGEQLAELGGVDGVNQSQRLRPGADPGAGRFAGAGVVVVDAVGDRLEVVLAAARPQLADVQHAMPTSA